MVSYCIRASKSLLWNHGHVNMNCIFTLCQDESEKYRQTFYCCMADFPQFPVTGSMACQCMFVLVQQYWKQFDIIISYVTYIMWIYSIHLKTNGQISKHHKTKLSQTWMITVGWINRLVLSYHNAYKCNGYLLSNLAIPKSPTFTRASLVRNMFCKQTIKVSQYNTLKAWICSLLLTGIHLIAAR